ncbi:glycosyltransferase [Arthrobacter sp. ISL-95]|uniref:glycosyltransferase n=1 Tax=Arthrobacter sp. ISL-95 TaxID=2819116 RepID=UPI001BED2291|nr:glycosyltransferase [Arthrobacter sp. ISL-95]MBT2587291.1 glycosyltransferase [Arthrobacter sp. ISL-95]
MSDTIMYISGGQWNGVPGTDRLLAEALSVRAKVLWVDHPVSVVRDGDVRRHTVRSFHGETESATPTVRRLRVPALPGFTRPLLRRSTEAIARWTMQSAGKKWKDGIAGVVNASPLVQFPRGLSAPRLLHLTDDWLASAELMGLSRTHLQRVLSANIAAADVITAVSPELARKISEFSGRKVEFLPNGCRAPVPADPGTVRQPVAVLVGQLNERLDFATLSELGRTMLPIIVLGPRTERDPSAKRSLNEFLSRPNVDWRGEVPPREVARVLDMATIGLTPYTDSEFNRSSFPLKTLEYLAFGVPVVATELPATRWIDSEFVKIAATSGDFVDLVRSGLETVLTTDQQRKIQASAQGHTWDVRAEKLLSLLGEQKTTEPVSERAPRHLGGK